MHYFCKDVVIDPSKEYNIEDTMEIGIVLEIGVFKIVEAIIVDIKTVGNVSKLYFEYINPRNSAEIAKSIFILSSVAADPQLPNYG